MPEFGDHLIFTLASKTGWADEYLRFKLPLSRMLRLYHCALYAEGAWTVPVGKPKDTEFDELAKFASMLTSEDDEC